MPSSVASFNSGYLAVGSVTSCCDGVHLSLARGVLWSSGDGHTWTLQDHVATFDHTLLERVWSDGSRLVVTGYVAASATDDEKTAPAIWTSADGARWLRGADPAPSRVVIGGPGLLGAVTTSTGAFGVGTTRFVASSDGQSWTQTSDTYAVALTALVAAPDGSAMALGLVPGPIRADGMPSTDVVALESATGTSWSGPRIVAHGAVSTALLHDKAGFVAFGFSSTALADGSISAEDMIWRFDPDGGVTATPMPLADGDSAVWVMVAHDVIVAVVSSITNSTMIRTSTDGGVTWVPVAALDPLDALEPYFGGIVETPGGLLGVGSRWDGESAHRLPVAWLSDR